MEDGSGVRNRHGYQPSRIFIHDQNKSFDEDCVYVKRWVQLRYSVKHIQNGIHIILNTQK